MVNKKLLFVVNVDWFFISHRLPIAKKAINEGFSVVIACHFTSHREELESMGFKTIEVPFNRSGSGVVGELITLLKLRKVLKQEMPSIIHTVTIKPVLYSGIVLKTFSHRIQYVAAISGLGYVFTASSIRAKVTRVFVSLLYKIALSQKNKIVIFQNSSDESIITNLVNLKCEQKVLIKGSGADLNTYAYLPEIILPPVKIVMACRLLREKGVYEFIDAAKYVKKNYPQSEFLLVGTPDPENPNSITQKEIDHWIKQDIITYLGHRNDIPDVFSGSNIVCLPSFYGEGVPKVLIEAAACGRAIVTTNNPGCRDAVIEGETGIIVPIRDAKALAIAIEKLINKPELRISMGKKARSFAEKEFDVRSVVNKHLQIYGKLISRLK